jgi:NTE family protein
MRALVLSGGGARGAYQLGVLKKVLKDEQRKYDILCGVSVGAINAAGLAQFPVGDEEAAWVWLNELWQQINPERIYKEWPLWPVSVVTHNAVYDSEPMRDLILDNLDIEAVLRSGRKLRIGVTSWETGEYFLATESTPHLGWCTAASASYPVVFQPVRVNGKVCTDGGARNVTPLGAALDLGATEIDVIMTSNPDEPRTWDPEGKYTQDYLMRLLELFSDEVMRTDLQCFGINNPYVELKPQYRDIKFRLLQPRKMADHDSLDFTQENIQAMIQMGYKEAYEENF